MIIIKPFLTLQENITFLYYALRTLEIAALLYLIYAVFRMIKALR